MSKPVTVTLGGMHARAQALVESGRYASLSEVLREGLRALERQEAMLDDLLREKIAEALADPRPSVPLDEAMQRVRQATRRT